MPDNERRKGQHLTWEDRHEIQKGLREHRSFKEISDIIGCSPDTISKEIRNHRYHKIRNNKKGIYSSFDNLTQEKVLLMINHINNTARPKLHGSTPMKKALQSFGKNAMERLGLEIILPDDFCLKPELLK